MVRTVDLTEVVDKQIMCNSVVYLFNYRSLGKKSYIS